MWVVYKYMYWSFSLDKNTFDTNDKTLYIAV